MAALNYFEQGGQSLLVTRVTSGSYTPAVASIINGTGVTTASVDLTLTNAITSSTLVIVGASTLSFVPTGSAFTNTATTKYYTTGSTLALSLNSLTGSINSSSLALGVSSSCSATQLSLQTTITGENKNNYYVTALGSTTYFTGGTNQVGLVLETLSAGIVMNNNSASYLTSASNGALISGSSANIRWEVTSNDTGSGLFNIIIRRGDDYQNSKTVLETWNGLSLDPNQSNYVAYVIGDQAYTVATDDLGNNYLQTTGSYQNKSKYVRVKTVNTPTPSYTNQYGQAQLQYTASIPVVGSGSYNGSFGSATGAIFGSFGKEPVNFFENIANVPSTTSTTNSNIQGVFASDYNTAINLLGNKDAYKFNILYAPGLTAVNAASQINSIINNSQTRGDNIAVIDMVGYGQSIPTAINEVNGFDSSYAATYWPWVQLRSRETGKVNFVPASTIVPAAYEYNDKVGAEWFAPAGLNRGGLSTVLQPERRLTSSDRDRLYQASINPIAIFPGVGTVIYGQKTLQNKASALDRVNVRRLLISLKSYIGQIGENLVFEPNTQVTRNKFINQVNPYLESVQQRQGLYAFQVIMDDTNNTPDVVDRNQLVGTIYLQPTKTAEFIQLDFNILPTGATFGQ
jgi:phage tail sheath protein FI